MRTPPVAHHRDGVAVDGDRGADLGECLVVLERTIRRLRAAGAVLIPAQNRREKIT